MNVYTAHIKICSTILESSSHRSYKIMSNVGRGKTWSNELIKTKNWTLVTNKGINGHVWYNHVRDNYENDNKTEDINPTNCTSDCDYEAGNLSMQRWREFLSRHIFVNAMPCHLHVIHVCIMIADEVIIQPNHIFHVHVHVKLNEAIKFW